MKKTFLYIGFLISLWGCQQEIENLEEMKNRQPDDKATVLFQPVMPADITYATDIVPMSRATDDTIRASVYKNCKAIFLKKIENNWFVDTVVDHTFTSLVAYENYIPVRSNTRFDPIRVELRPGQYKMALFFNPYALSWNKLLKPGTFIATDEDLSAGKNLPFAATINIVGENGYTTNSIDRSLVIGTEVFSGSTDFTVGKNDHLETNNSPVSLKVQMHRRVGRLRYLLKIDPSGNTSSFPDAQYFLKATLTAPEGKAFCDGLNVLGLPDYAEKKRTELLLYISAERDYFYSEKDRTIYRLPVNVPKGFVTPKPSGPTNFSPFILTDEPMNCTLQIKVFLGQSGDGIDYLYEKPLSFLLAPSRVTGWAFEVDPDFELVREGNNWIGRVRLIPEVNARQSFHLYYELNPVIYYLPEQP